MGRAAFTGRWFPGSGAIDPLILSQSRTTFAFFIFLPVLWLARGWRRLRLSFADFGSLLVLGVLGVAASNYFYYLAIQRTGVAIAITVQYTAPAWVLLYMVVAGEQKMSLRGLIAVVLALAGIAFVVGITGARGLHLERIGVVAALLAALSFAFYNIGGHRLVARHDHWTVLLYITFGASFFWILINPPWKIAAHHYSGAVWVFLFAFSIVSVLLPFSFYIAGLSFLDPTRAIIVSCLEPVFSILLTAVFLKEVIRPLQAFGIALVLAAIVVIQLSDGKSKERVLVEPIE